MGHAVFSGKLITPCREIWTHTQESNYSATTITLPTRLVQPRAPPHAHQLHHLLHLLLHCPHLISNNLQQASHPRPADPRLYPTTAPSSSSRSTAPQRPDRAAPRPPLLLRLEALQRLPHPARARTHRTPAAHRGPLGSPGTTSHTDGGTPPYPTLNRLMCDMHAYPASRSASCMTRTSSAAAAGPRGVRSAR